MASTPISDVNKTEDLWVLHYDAQFSLRNVCLGSVGIVMNILSLVLIHTKTDLKMNARLNIYCLVITDLIVLTSTALYGIVGILRMKTSKCWFVSFVFVSSHIASHSTVTVISSFNFMAVFYPLYYRMSMTSIRVGLSLMVMWIIVELLAFTCVGYNIPGTGRCMPLSLLPVHGILLYVSVLSICDLLTVCFTVKMCFKLINRHKVGPVQASSRQHTIRLPWSLQTEAINTVQHLADHGIIQIKSEEFQKTKDHEPNLKFVLEENNGIYQKIVTNIDKVKKYSSSKKTYNILNVSTDMEVGIKSSSFVSRNETNDTNIVGNCLFNSYAAGMNVFQINVTNDSFQSDLAESGHDTSSFIYNSNGSMSENKTSDSLPRKLYHISKDNASDNYHSSKDTASDNYHSSKDTASDNLPRDFNHNSKDKASDSLQRVFNYSSKDAASGGLPRAFYDSITTVSPKNVNALKSSTYQPILNADHLFPSTSRCDFTDEYVHSRNMHISPHMYDSIVHSKQSPPNSIQNCVLPISQSGCLDILPRKNHLRFNSTWRLHQIISTDSKKTCSRDTSQKDIHRKIASTSSELPRINATVPLTAHKTVVTFTVLTLWCGLLHFISLLILLWMVVFERDWKLFLVSPPGLASTTLSFWNALSNPVIYAWRFGEWKILWGKIKGM